MAVVGAIEAERATHGVELLLLLPITRVSHKQFVYRCWQLGHNVTPYDAAYVALAETRALPLATLDRKLANAPSLKCETVHLTF